MTNFKRYLLDKTVFGWPGFILLAIVLFFIFQPLVCGGSKQEVIRKIIPKIIHTGGGYPSVFSDPGWFDYQTTPDTVAIIQYRDRIDTVYIEVRSVEVSQDTILLEVIRDSVSTSLIGFEIPEYGTATGLVDPATGELVLHYSWSSFEPAVTVGATPYGVNVGLESMYFRNVLFLKNIHAPVLIIEKELWWDEYQDWQVGVGVSVDLWREAHLGGGIVWNTSNFSEYRATVFLNFCAWR